MDIRESKLAHKFDVIRLYKDGFSEREIQLETHIPKSTIHDIITKYNKYGTVMRLSSSDRPKALNEEDMKFLVESVEKDPKKSSIKLTLELNEKRDKVVSDRTVRNALNEYGFNCRVPRRLPLLSSKNISNRLRIANRWSNVPLNQWDRVLFSDETKINLFSSDGRINVWRKEGEALLSKNSTPTVKHGNGSVMVWGCMSSSGVGKLVFIDGIMDQYAYKRILCENIQPSKEILGLDDDFIFQHDNDPKHTSNYVKEFFKNPRINTLEWPSQSPDLNPIEHLWDHMKREVRKASPKTKKELREKIVEIWNDISPDICRKLVHTMPKRIEEIVRAKGGHSSF